MKKYQDYFFYLDCNLAVLLKLTFCCYPVVEIIHYYHLLLEQAHFHYC